MKTVPYPMPSLPTEKPVSNRPATAQSFLAGIAPELAEADRQFDQALAAYSSPMQPMVEHLRHYRGKRLRPALVYLTAKSCGSVQPHHHTLAAVVEMIHTATLVHDDVLDDAHTRRHINTFNAEWGNKISILFGDMLFTQAFHLTSQVDQRACQLIGAATNRVCAGELHQVCQQGNLHLSESEYFDILYGKTGALTEVAARLGAIYAGAGEQVVEAAAQYGRCLGMAFQIADDLLDLAGQEEQTGKTLGTDLAQGKLTLPLIHALQELPRPQSAALRDSLSQPGQLNRNWLHEQLHKTGSWLYARRVAEDYIRTAQLALEELPQNEWRGMLERIATWAISRER